MDGSSVQVKKRLERSSASTATARVRHAVMPCLGANLTKNTPVPKAALHQKRDRRIQLAPEPMKGNRKTAATPANASVTNSANPKATSARFIIGADASALVNRANVVRKPWNHNHAGPRASP